MNSNKCDESLLRSLLGRRLMRVRGTFYRFRQEPDQSPIELELSFEATGAIVIGGASDGQSIRCKSGILSPVDMQEAGSITVRDLSMVVPFTNCIMDTVEMIQIIEGTYKLAQTYSAGLAFRMSKGEEFYIYNWGDELLYGEAFEATGPPPDVSFSFRAI